jgi:hypothetical protein
VTIRDFSRQRRLGHSGANGGTQPDGFSGKSLPGLDPGRRPVFPAKMPHRKNAGAFLFPAHVKPL